MQNFTYCHTHTEILAMAHLRSELYLHYIVFSFLSQYGTFVYKDG